MREPYEACVYFHGGLTAWSGKPHPREVIARRRSRWLWMAHARGLTVLQQIDDAGRCGLLVRRGEEILVHVPAADTNCEPDPSEAWPFPT